MPDTRAYARLRLPPTPMPSSISIILTVTLALFAPLVRADEPDREPLEMWLAFQRGVRTIEADFVQIRELRTLRGGLRSEGKVWIDRKRGRFRWQTGDEAAPKAVAIKVGDTLTLMQPDRRRAQQVALDDTATRDGGAAAFDFATGGMPDSLAELEEAFMIEDITRDESATWRVRLRPRSGKARETLDEAVLLIDAGRYFLHGFEMTFRDRSVVKTTFTRQEFNVALPDSLFSPDLSGYTIKE